MEWFEGRPRAIQKIRSFGHCQFVAQGSTVVCPIRGARGGASGVFPAGADVVGRVPIAAQSDCDLSEADDEEDIPAHASHLPPY